MKAVGEGLAPPVNKSALDVPLKCKIGFYPSQRRRGKAATESVILSKQSESNPKGDTTCRDLAPITRCLSILVVRKTKGGRGRRPRRPVSPSKYKMQSANVCTIIWYIHLRFSLFYYVFVSLLLSQRLSSSENGRNDPPRCSRNRRFISCLCLLLGGGSSISLISSSIMRIFESMDSNIARLKSSRFSFDTPSKNFSLLTFSISCFAILT